MKKIILILLILLTACTHHVPKPNDGGTRFLPKPIPEFTGIDGLGLAMEPLPVIKKNLKPNTSIGVLQGTFGNVIPKLRELLQTMKVDMFRAHLLNWTCFRNHNCESGEPTINDLVTLGNRAAQFENLHREFPQVQCYLSPALEYDTTDTSLIAAWLSKIRQKAPSCTPVLSPYKGALINGEFFEKHGNKAIGDFVSNDGESYFDSNTDIFNSSGRVASLAWWNRLNLRTSGEKSWTPPSKRTATVWADEIRQAMFLLRNKKTNKPQFKSCPNARELKSPEIWKTRSEDYNGGDKRENKAVLIVKGVFSKGFTITNPQGKLVGCLRYFGPYSGTPGYFRYYIGNCSGQDPYNLMQDSGGEWVCLKNGHTQFAVSAIRRSGKER